MKIGSKEVILCHRPSFMGCEENVLPMWWPFGSGGSFEFNDLHNTGFMGCNPRLRFSREKLIIFRSSYELELSERINSILKSYGNRYAFFYEESQRPLEDGYIRRCRFVREDVVPQLYRSSVTKNETKQYSKALEVLFAFLKDDTEWDNIVHDIYKNYYNSPYFRKKYMDEDQFALGSGVVWEEQDGILRAWTRVIYVPK